MLGFNRSSLAVACGMVLAGSTAALGDGGLMITLLNDSPDNLMVTLYDQGTQPPQQLLANRELYGNASMTVSIGAGRRGHGHVSWTAVTADHDMRKCGHGENRQLNDGDTVKVHADGDCSA